MSTGLSVHWRQYPQWSRQGVIVYAWFVTAYGLFLFCWSAHQNGAALLVDQCLPVSTGFHCEAWPDAYLVLMQSLECSPTISAQSYDHSQLANTYWFMFMNLMFDARRVANLTHMHHLFTRAIYECLLEDDRVPAPSSLSRLLPYSHPKAGVSVYRRLGGQEYIDVEIGDITYVLGEHFCTCSPELAMKIHSSVDLPFNWILDDISLVGWFRKVKGGGVVSKRTDGLAVRCWNLYLACKHLWLHNQRLAQRRPSSFQPMMRSQQDLCGMRSFSTVLTVGYPSSMPIERQRPPIQHQRWVVSIRRKKSPVGSKKDSSKWINAWKSEQRLRLTRQESVMINLLSPHLLDAPCYAEFLRLCHIWRLRSVGGEWELRRMQWLLRLPRQEPRRRWRQLILKMQKAPPSTIGPCLHSLSSASCFYSSSIYVSVNWASWLIWLVVSKSSSFCRVEHIWKEWMWDRWNWRTDLDSFLVCMVLGQV